MRRMTRTASAAIAVGILSWIAIPAQAQNVTAYEGARLIVGDGRVIENATVVVDGTRITQAGAGIQVPAGAKRVSLAGKTVMPTMIDTHVHLSGKRETLVRDLKQRAYWGVSTAMSTWSARAGGWLRRPKWRSWQPHSEIWTPLTSRVELVWGTSSTATRRPASPARSQIVSPHSGRWGWVRRS